MINETKKILDRPDIAVTATAVRVPVANCHSVSINVEFYKRPDIAEVRKILAASEGITVYDAPDEMKYPIPTLADGKDSVFVGRIRTDTSQKNTLDLWTVTDNIRKGAALNAVQILERLL